MRARPRRPGARRLGSILRRRWALLLVAAVVALLYSRPVATYWHVRQVVAHRSAQIQLLQAEQTRLTARLHASTSESELAREARRLGMVKPGEQLYIVKGIGQWRRVHRATIRGDG